MSSDDAYAAFLEKANQDVSGGGEASAQQANGESKRIRIQAEKEVEVPSVLRGIDDVYMSESDEPFEGVGLAWEGDLGVASLREALSLTPETHVEELSERDFDRRDEYGDVLGKVKGAGDGRVKVFRIELDDTRSEIWILSLVEGGGRAVGVRTLSVET